MAFKHSSHTFSKRISDKIKRKEKIKNKEKQFDAEMYKKQIFTEGLQPGHAKTCNILKQQFCVHNTLNP